MARRSAVGPLKVHDLFGSHLLDHLAAHRAGLTAGQVAVVALLQVDADLLGRLHLELIQGRAGVRDGRLIGSGRHKNISFALRFVGWGIRT